MTDFEKRTDNDILSIYNDLRHMESAVLNLKIRLVTELKEKYKFFLPGDCIFENITSSNMRILFMNLYEASLSLTVSIQLLEFLEKNNIICVWQLLAKDEFPLESPSQRIKTQYKNLKRQIIEKFRIKFEE